MKKFILLGIFILTFMAQANSSFNIKEWLLLRNWESKS